jgi:hypothetical protein
MNLPYQPLTLTFAFHPERMPEAARAEFLHLGASRLQQIFQSAKKHGRFVCMFEKIPGFMPHVGQRRSIPLVPWLGLNLKISLLCDKRRDILLSLGINLHEPRVVQDFVSFLFRLSLSPSIPDFYYTLDRRISLEQAQSLAEQEVVRLLQQEDQQWAEDARTRLEEELAMLEAYYKELAAREEEQIQDEVSPSEAVESAEQAVSDSPPQTATETSMQTDGLTVSFSSRETVEERATLGDYMAGGGRILDFLRANGIQTTPREEISQEPWKSSTPAEERKRRMDELKWQYEPRIEVETINGGLFYLHSLPGSGRMM